MIAIVWYTEKHSNSAFVRLCVWSAVATAPLFVADKYGVFSCKYCHHHHCHLTDRNTEHLYRGLPLTIQAATLISHRQLPSRSLSVIHSFDATIWVSDSASKLNIAYEAAVCLNPHSSSKWAPWFTRQLGHKHTLCQNVVSATKLLVLGCRKNITCWSEGRPGVFCLLWNCVSVDGVKLLFREPCKYIILFQLLFDILSFFVSTFSATWAV